MEAGICEVTATHTTNPIMLPEVPKGQSPGQPTPKPSTSLAVATWPVVMYYSRMSPGKPPSEAYMAEGRLNIGKAAPTSSTVITC